MTSASMTEVKSQFGDYLKAAKDGPVVVTRKGKPVAVLVGVQSEDDVEQIMMAYSPKLRRILKQSAQEIREGHGLSHDDFWARAAERAKHELQRDNEGPTSR